MLNVLLALVAVLVIGSDPTLHEGVRSLICSQSPLEVTHAPENSTVEPQGEVTQKPDL